MAHISITCASVVLLDTPYQLVTLGYAIIKLKSDLDSVNRSPPVWRLFAKFEHFFFKFSIIGNRLRNRACNHYRVQYNYTSLVSVQSTQGDFK